jgi:hypothetical protein
MTSEEFIKGVILTYYKDTTIPKISALKILNSEPEIPTVSLSWKESRKTIKVKAFLQEGAFVVTKLI